LSVGSNAPPIIIDKRQTKRDINDRLRFKVMKRDNFKCQCCGKSPAVDLGTILHVDHIKPWAKGGETVLEKLQTLCSKCNIGKGDLH
jgi:5-methylcytosine-specific restriction endonuclease McrA